MTLESIPFDLAQVVRHAMAPMALRAQAQSLVLKTDVPAYVPEWVLGDPGRLRQVLLNLVGNAIKFTEEGTVTVSVRLKPPPGPGQKPRLRFGVRDTGIGIAPDRLHSVFEAFSQADSSITRRYGGTGLGLTISARLVGLMGGQLQVDSQLGQGTEFWFELPMTVAEAPELAPESEVAPQQHLTVLVAEDHPINQVVARKVLEGLGHRVTIVGNGLQAVEQFESGSFDLIFMDIQMPELDGFGATQRIRALEAAQTSGQRIPILAMTAHAMEGYREKCIRGGMDGYVTKPVDRKQLVSEINRVVAPSRVLK
jgi:CheY-like chemotaxis protein